MIVLLRRLLDTGRALLHRRRIDQDLDEELQAYLESGIDRHMQAGMSREAATRAARIEIGSRAAVTQQVREAHFITR